MRYASLVPAALLILAACSEGERPAEEIDLSAAAIAAFEVTDVSGAPLGTVQLTQSCTEAAAVHLGRGLALLHSMTYEDSESAFAKATEADPDCAMGYWGQAMTIVHPLWSDPPSEARFESGRALVEKARARAGSDHELAYVDALAAYYEAGRGDSEKPNLVAFEEGWRGFQEMYPGDPEGKAFYALAQLGTVDPGDKTYSKQRVAGAMAEQVLAAIPDHPGAHHYIIHAYDNPELSALAVDVARSYGKVAPDIPHALHMPTHTFTRLGLWQESIDWNRRSADAALKRPVGSEISLHYFHALDYLAYAFLQGAEDQRAVDVLNELAGVEPPYQAHFASAYTFAAVPARVAVERQMWEAAADLEARWPSAYPWDTAPAMEAITYFARALGAARSGRFEQARADLETLAAMQEQVAAGNAYWGTQVEIQRLSALAWLKFEEGSREQALSTMRSAAELESTTEKHPITPGEVLPARELLGDMLLELGQPREALAEYEAALDRSPNRFNSLYGAGRAAELAGDGEIAARYYGALIEVTAKADTERERLAHARAYLAGIHGSGA
jgi:tetratricopeptide (TPR) repeat protein